MPQHAVHFSTAVRSSKETFTFHAFHSAPSAQRWRGLLHTFIKQTQWQMPNKRATKCDQHPPIFSTVLCCIALLTDCIVFDVYRASQARDHRHSLHLQSYALSLLNCQLSMYCGINNQDEFVQLTLDVGMTKGTCKALAQSLRARTASLMSLDRMPNRISGG